MNCSLLFSTNFRTNFDYIVKWTNWCDVDIIIFISISSYQNANFYKLKHLSKVEVVTNDPSGNTFTLVSHIFRIGEKLLVDLSKY